VDLEMRASDSDAGEVEVLSDSPSRRTKTPALDEFGSNLTQMAAAGA